MQAMFYLGSGSAGVLWCVLCSGSGGDTSDRQKRSESYMKAKAKGACLHTGIYTYTVLGLGLEGLYPLNAAPWLAVKSWTESGGVGEGWSSVTQFLALACENSII